MYHLRSLKEIWTPTAKRVMPIETQGLFTPKTQFQNKAQNICKKESKCQLKIYNKHMFQALCNIAKKTPMNI
jgi:hypothetical protein